MTEDDEREGLVRSPSRDPQNVLGTAQGLSYTRPP